MFCRPQILVQQIMIADKVYTVFRVMELLRFAPLMQPPRFPLSHRFEIIMSLISEVSQKLWLNRNALIVDMFTKLGPDLWNRGFQNHLQGLVSFGSYGLCCCLFQNFTLPFNKYAWVTTHNSYAIVDETSLLGVTIVSQKNQEDSVTSQLNVNSRNLGLFSLRSPPI
jgi:hypothetical protein